MKALFAVSLFVWLMCGLAGAWVLGGSDGIRLAAVARGPITLLKAFKENPPSLPGP